MAREITRLHGYNSAGTYSAAKVGKNGAVRSIGYERYAVSDDSIVVASDITTEAETTAPYICAITLPAGEKTQSVFNVTGNLPYTFKLYEAETTDVTTGNLITQVRRNRESTISDTEYAWTKSGVTVADAGTLLYEEFSGGSTGKANKPPAGEKLMPGEGWQLGSGKTYLVYVEPTQNDGTFSIVIGHCTGSHE